MRPNSPFTKTPSGTVRVAVRLTPKAARAGIGGLYENADGTVALKVTVTAVPEGGKANKALIALLAKEWRMAKGSVAVVGGTTDRRKVLEIETKDSAAVSARLEDWLSERLRGSST